MRSSIMEKLSSTRHGLKVPAPPPQEMERALWVASQIFLYYQYMLHSLLVTSAKGNENVKFFFFNIYRNCHIFGRTKYDGKQKREP